MESKSESIWESLEESFDEKLPRRTAVALKPSDSTILYAYPAALGRVGWCFDDRVESGYDEKPAFELFLAPWINPGIAGKPALHSSFVWESQRYRPDLVSRRGIYSDNGITINEQFGRAVEGALTWRLGLEHKAIRHYERSLYAVLRVERGLKGLRDTGGVFEAEGLALAAGAASWGAYDHLEDAEADLLAGGLSGKAQGTRYLVLELKTDLGPKGFGALSLGLSLGDVKAAEKARQIEDLATPIRERWDSWLNSLPRTEFATPEERQAYYKCWWIVKLNYYENPRFGHMVCEALPVYRGYWLWGLDASEWHSDQDTDYTSAHVRNALNLFMDYQREDGFITHAIYLHEGVPGEGWGCSSITQTPHIPWVALRYAEATGDRESLARWYPGLVRFHRYLCESRDAGFRNLHLWAVTTSFDCGLDTTSVLERVTYGENGVKERYCYASIFAAERCRYEQALARMAEILGTGETDHWLAEAEKTRQAMDAVLWDPERNWYGALHEDGTLDTRVGVDGLFPLAYGLVDSEKAEAAKSSFRRLIARYGIHTVAPGEPGFEADHYWRGPAWPKSCAMGIVAARNYYPDLLEETVESTVRMLLRWPSVWECLNAETGEVARGDQGLCATPVVSSNVGSGEALGALLTARGVDMMAFDGTLPLAPVENFHWAGFRLDLRRANPGWALSVREAEKRTGTLRLRKPDGSVLTLEIEAGRTYAIL